MHFTRSTIAAVAVILPSALAQTFTSCSPLEKTCPADVGLNEPGLSVDFTQGKSSSFNEAAGTTLSYGSNGAEFKISQYGQAPTLQSNFYFLFGRVDVVMQAAPGVGVISSVVLESDDLDEIDFEWLGGDANNVQSNYFGKGNTTTYDRAQFEAVSSPQTSFHTYSLDWTAERCIYSIDGKAVRTLTYAQANDGSNYPQTPMRLKLGNWTPPSNAEGTIQWAGGPVNWASAPFSMYVKSVTIQNYNPADSYEYGDMTGSWQSIKIINGSSSSTPGGSSGQSSSASSAAATTTASAVGTGSPSTIPSTATVAPTSTLSVAPIQMTHVPSSNSSQSGGVGGTGTGVPSSSSPSSSTSSASPYPAPPATNSASRSLIQIGCLLTAVAGSFLLL